LAACCNEIKQDKGKAARFMGCFFSCRKSGILCRKKGNESLYFAVCDVSKKSGAKNVPIFSKNTKYTLVQRGNLGYS
jgi:hypothetical protein